MHCCPIRTTAELSKRLILFAVLLANSVVLNVGCRADPWHRPLNVERRSHTATLLENGKVLIVGGDNQNGIVSQAEIFDPVSQISALAAALITPRTDHSATRLSDGRVLVIGGRDQTGSLQSTEIYNPLTTSFIAGPAMMRARSGHTATISSERQNSCHWRRSLRKCGDLRSCHAKFFTGNGEFEYRLVNSTVPFCYKTVRS